MAKRTTKKVNSGELDTKEFFAAIAQIEAEKGIKKGYMLEKITQALISAYRRDHEGVGDNLTVETDENLGTVRMYLRTMFGGEYRHNLDSKNRIFIPAKLRDDLGSLPKDHGTGLG